MAKFEGKTALVTGAGSGIGRAAALAFAAEGATVIVADIQEKSGKETLLLLEENGGRGAFIPVDVSKKQSIRQMFASVFERYDRLHIAINNAGTGGIPAFFAEYQDDHWDEVIAVNQSSVFYCMREELRHMHVKGGGAIVNVASVAGLKALPRAVAYTASKHAVVGMTKTAAVEYARSNIRVNAVCPAFTRTRMVDQLFEFDPSMEQKLLTTIPMRRYGKVEEIAGAILWLCEETSGFVTGISLPLDGGLTA